MPQQPNPASAHANANVMFFVMLLSAAMIAGLGTVLPGMMEFEGAESLIMRCVFYAVAIGDVIIAFWLRNKLRKADPANKSSGAVRRQ